VFKLLNYIVAVYQHLENVEELSNTNFCKLVSFSIWRCCPMRAVVSSFVRFSWSHTTTHHCQQDSYGQVISPSQRPLP